ncbi:MAG: type VI secretion system tube protein Hcp [Cytophagaceae bacterium]|nr:type VI secretion system tube protein Hcp [Cytophagaceae bacterium]
MKKIFKLIFLVILTGFKIQAQDFEMFMDVDGIPGEYVTNPNRASVFTPAPNAQTIAILSSDFIESRTIAKNNNTMEPGNPNLIREMEISFILDKATPLLLEKMWQRQLISSIKIYTDRLYNNGLNQDEFIKTELTNVFIKSISMQSSEESAPVFSMTITFEKIKRSFALRDNYNVLIDAGNFNFNYVINDVD